MGGTRAAVLVTVAFGVLSAPASLAAQATIQRDGGDLAYLSVNALVGGLSAGIFSHARGGSFFEPFARGALGGSVSYFGKRLSGGGFPAAGLVGRQVAAAGASIIRSAAFGEGLLDTLFVPLGPGRLHVPLRSREGPSYRLDAEELGWLVYSFSRDHLDFDAAASLASGAFVFAGDERLRGEHDTAIGRAAPGVISIRRLDGDRYGATLAHERVHIAQLDHLKIVWGLPFEGWLRDEWGIGRESGLGRVDVGMGYYPILWLLTAPWPTHATRPLEREAEFVESLWGG